MKKSSGCSDELRSLVPNLQYNTSSSYKSISQLGYKSDGKSVSSSEVVDSRFKIIGNIGSDTEFDDDCTVTTADEFSFILSNSLPITLTFFMEYSLTIISLLIVGHLMDAEKLASASLAVMTYNITGLSSIEGLASSLDTFCSQAFGAQKYSKVGLYFLRFSAMILGGSLFIIAIWWWSAWWLKFLIPETKLLPNVQLYLRVMVFGIPGITLFETGKRFLQAQGHFKPSTFVLAVVMPINISLVLVLTRWLGFIGAPIGIVISQWLMCIFLLGYAYFIIPVTRQCWYPFTETWSHFTCVFSHWRPLWKLALPGLVMVEAEYLSFELLTVMSTYFGVEAIAAQTVITNLSSLVYQIPFAIGCVVSTRVANHIGMSMPINAQTSVKAAYQISAFVGVANMSLIAIFNKPLSKMFTNNNEVINSVHKISYILAFNQLFDSLMAFGAAILRGQGKQRSGGFWNIICYYFIALPISSWLAFGSLKLKLAGLWFGSGVSIFLLAVIFAWKIYHSDWDTIISDFLKREADEPDFDLESIETTSTNFNTNS